MTAKVLVVGAALFAAFLTGCVAKTIDASTDQKMFASIEGIRNGLLAGERLQFDEAMAVIMRESMTAGFATVFAGTNAASTFDASLRAQLHGKTAAQVIALAKEKDQARRRVQAATEEENRLTEKLRQEREAKQAEVYAELLLQKEKAKAEISRIRTKLAADSERVKAEQKSKLDRIMTAFKAQSERLVTDTKTRAEQAQTPTEREAIVADAQAQQDRLLAAAQTELKGLEAEGLAEIKRLEAQALAELEGIKAQALAELKSPEAKLALAQALDEARPFQNASKIIK